MAGAFIAQGLCLQRVRKPEAETMKDPLAWAKEVASSGGLVMPIGFIADIGHMIFRRRPRSAARRKR